MRLVRTLVIALVALGSTLALAPAAVAAATPAVCVTIYNPQYPGYAAPTCV